VVEIMPRACGTMIIRSRKGRRQQEENRPDVPGAEPERVTVAPRVSEPIKAEPAAPVARLRFRTGRVGMVRLLSHLESATAWIRALRRAGLPLAYSQGFHAHPKVTFSLASPVGEETEDDPMDVELTGEVDPEAARKALAAVLPAGFSVRSVRPVPLNAPSLMADLAAITYTLMLPIPPDEAWRRVEALLEQDQLMVFRSVKHRSAPGGRAVVPVDLKPLITELAVEATVPSEDRAVLRLRTCSRDGRLVKSREILELLGVDPLRCRVIRRRVDLAAEASDALVSVR
jgi:radical SAM-linked protein